jgi:DNA polymerase III epsilon subunit-like protein
MAFNFQLWEREHKLERLADKRYTCEVCRRVWARKPRTVCAGLPIYDFKARPADLLTFTQLRRLKRWPADRSEPDGAYFVRKSPYRRYLYSLEQSRPWRTPTPRQREAIQKMRVGLVQHYTCQRCGYYDKSHGKDKWATHVRRGWCAACWNKWNQEYRQREVCKRLHAFAEEEYLILDSETTGLDFKVDEIVELSILHSSGVLLFSSLIRPTNFYPGRALASSIHGLHYEDLEHAPTLEEVWPQVSALLRRYRRCIIYNAVFDVSMLESGAKRFGKRVPSVKWECLMEEVTWGWGGWSEYHQSYSYVSLDGACWVAHVKREQAHRAAADCRATLAVTRELVSRHGHLVEMVPPKIKEPRYRPWRGNWWTAGRDAEEEREASAFDPFLDADDFPGSGSAAPLPVGNVVSVAAGVDSDFDPFLDLDSDDLP